MAPRTSHAKLQTQAVKDSDAAANEALLAHAEFTRTAKSWLSAATGGGGQGLYDDDDEHDQDAASSDKDERGERPRKKAKLLDRLKPAGAGGGEEMNADMNGLGYIAPKDSSGNPITAQSVDPGTAFLRKQLLGRNRPRGGGLAGPPSTATSHGKKPPHGRDARYPARGAGNNDGSDSDEDEDSRSRLGKVKKPQRRQPQSIRAASALEINAGVDRDRDPNDDDDDDRPTGNKNVADEESKADQDTSETTLPGPPSNGPRQTQSASRPVRMSYLDEMLAERERKKMKKKKKKQKN